MNIAKSLNPPLHPAARYFDRVELHRLGEARPAGLWIASLPIPPGVETALSLGGQPTYAESLGEWPGLEGQPRRLLMVADGGEASPATLRPSALKAATGTVPEAELAMLEESQDRFYYWRTDCLKLKWQDRSVRLMMGLRVDGKVNWGQFSRLVVEQETPTCRVITMSGTIPVVQVTRGEITGGGYNAPFLHHQNWVYGFIYARLHSNGVCEIYARHTNSKFVDGGREFRGVVPVLGISVDGARPDLSGLSGLTTGQQEEFALGGVCFDVNEISRLGSPGKPGRVDVEDETLIWQPYLGVEIYGGLAPEQQTGSRYIFKAEDHVMPHGMSRTLRFTLSMNPERSPKVVRYQAPAWWYGLCEEFSPAPLLPVKNEYDKVLEYERQWIRHVINRGGFEDGSIPRRASSKDSDRPEPGWEGETPGAMFLSAYRDGDSLDHELALRSAYFFTDVCIDHAEKLVRMHGQAPPAMALPMNRIHSCLYAYLETGDPYLRDIAEAVVETSYRTHKNAWPRLSIGRDACFIRGAMLLYRYLNDKHYLNFARDSIRTVGESQFPDGSFGDQGGGTGVHGWNQYIVKPWMGCMALGGALDMLDMFPDDTMALTPARRFADWLMRERHELSNGVRGWSYQHGFNGGREFIQIDAVNKLPILLPGKEQWHLDYLARVLASNSLRTGDPSYFDAWAESFAAHWRFIEGGDKYRSGDHEYVQAWQYVPWVQQRLWNATLGENGLQLDPKHFGPRTPGEATILTPDGEVRVRWVDGKQWVLDSTVPKYNK
jgi:hypothetical protein